MAIIICPKCGKKVAVSLMQCMHCGYEFKFNEEKIQCPECEDWIIKTADGRCPECGHVFGNDFIVENNKLIKYNGKRSAVFIPSSITSIGNSAFSWCSSLTRITIPAGVTSIGENAFYHCSSLTSITIPGSVTSIGSWAFFGCSSLTSITVSIGNSHYCSENGILFNKDKSTLICYPAGKLNNVYTIPDSVTSIGKYAFYECSSLTSITIPAGVTSIGDYAFSKCRSLTSITFEGTKVQWNAISKASSWNEVTGNYTVHCTDGDVVK